MTDEEDSVAPSSNILQARAHKDVYQIKGHDTDNDNWCSKACSEDTSLDEVIQVIRCMKKE